MASRPRVFLHDRPLNVDEISKRLSMLENRWNGVVDDDCNKNKNDDDKNEDKKDKNDKNKKEDEEGEGEDDAQSEATVTTGTTTTGDGMDTPRASESQDGEYDAQDEIVSKVIANLQAKIEAVKRHRRVAAEVVALKKLLAEKEKDLVECERIMALEIGQVEG